MTGSHKVVLQPSANRKSECDSACIVDSPGPLGIILTIDHKTFPKVERLPRGQNVLESHGRYDYSNITRRPDYCWPAGQRLAVYIAINIEQFRFGKGKGAAIAPPDQAQSH